MPYSLADIRSEFFIHDDLRKRAEKIHRQMLQIWKRTQSIDAFAVSWPADTLQTADGKDISGAVMCQLPRDASVTERRELLKKLVTRTKAYGLVVVERHDMEIRVLFETHHGARAWITPLARHGDVIVPGRTAVLDNSTCVGLLWSPSHGSA